ncbi:hypothetical protein [Lysobacter solisilvae (ex Woo and Kim 2020)]|uniref:Uncharacterized protein n=1 Tax=Agrilutibacter terrestris TaxID=2865112 RepID=A0A7H0FWX3_9GAMM|nr:hypothetical protein [Lysobacter terrestris]QNP40539.1 hypothetical protein H8B22_13900 [Lysobacter terrestris]
MGRSKEPLYRRTNTRTHGVHREGGEYRHDRGRRDPRGEDVTRAPMHALRHGRDYTPLYRFLRSRVGRPWNEVHSEAIARLDTPEPIFTAVALPADDAHAMVRVGESTYVSGLRVDDAGLLQLVDPTLDARELVPYCRCCTHTFNGERFGGVFEGDA